MSVGLSIAGPHLQIMDFRKIKALIEVVTEKDIAELEVESSEGKIRIRRNTTQGLEQGPQPYVIVSSSALPAPAADATPALESSAPALPGAGPASAPASQPGKTEEEDLVVVTAPIVGTFYEASSPDAPPFVEVGDTVAAGQVLCIIEAMKLMNEIEAEAAGVIEKKFVSNAQPVEFGEALFAIKPDK